MNYNVDTIPQFDKQAKRLIKKFPSLKRDLSGLAESLAENPTQGKSLGNDFYKIRVAISSKGKGKSGGARVITFVKVLHAKVYLAAIYDKSERANISDRELDGLFSALKGRQ
jgi:hypothetical protein